MTDIEGIIRRVVREELERVVAPDAESQPLLRAGDPADRRSAGSALGDEILAQLARRRQTQAWLAAETGMPIATLSRRLRDPAAFRLGEIAAVARALGVDLRDLVSV
ncbi:helix-turn-helix transcriptional regulator [Curtobacterium sp. MCBA15_001]|uniref:helix-turn-helix domain-containing protein n=1 Tax=Curtobacterium sp. MCBA15_001 TaxID=1898731 RepID=UPI0008DCFF32|nr:helix-turn-helix transcriptional regulator [Curtobacterium sp. MCBA15_001]